MGTNPRQMNVLLVVRTRSVADKVVPALGGADVQFFEATTAEEVEAILGQVHLDHVIMGGGLDLESRLLIVRRVFETSSSTTVHMNSPSGPDSYLPFVKSVVHGLLNG